MTVQILQAIGVVVAGILAGEEFVVRYGVQPALSALEDRAHVLARQALIRRLRIVVPAMMLPATALGIAVLVSGGSGAGFGLRVATVVALAAVVLISFLGTVPINVRIDAWDVDALPDGWHSEIRRWERIDVFRSGAAVLAFALSVAAFAIGR